MNYLIRTMKKSEHTDQSWEDLFGIEDSARRNYCVVTIQRHIVIDDLLTFEQAKDRVKEEQRFDDMEEQAQQGDYQDEHLWV